MLALLAVGLGGCIEGFLTGGLSEPVPAPDFTAHTVSGENVTLSQLEGQVVLLDFMGTWCGPCQRGVPGLRDLRDAYPDLVLLPVSSTDSEAQLHDFQVRYQADWPHITDDGSIVRAYLEAGSSARQMMWPSYAIVDEDGMLRWYNRGETLPATFVAALDRVTGSEGPGFDRSAVAPIGGALLLGALAAHSPFLVAWSRSRRARSDPGTESGDAADVQGEAAPIDAGRAALWAVLLYLALGAVAAWFSRPLSGRVVNMAPFMAGAAVVAIIYWRSKGTPEVQASGKRLAAGSPWTQALAWNGHLFYYALPAWFAVLFAGMLRVSLAEVVLMHAAYGVGVAIALLAPWRRGMGTSSEAGQAANQDSRVRDGDRHAARFDPAWLGAAGLVAGALWAGVLYLR